MTKNCPNCGAPIQNERCEFCGTLFYDFSTIPIGEPFILRVKTRDGKIIQGKAYLTNATLEMGSKVCYYDNEARFYCPHRDLTMEFSLLSLEV